MLNSSLEDCHYKLRFLLITTFLTFLLNFRLTSQPALRNYKASKVTVSYYIRSCTITLKAFLSG